MRRLSLWEEEKAKIAKKMKRCRHVSDECKMYVGKALAKMIDQSVDNEFFFVTL